MMFLLIFTLILTKGVQGLQVIGGNITVLNGSTAIFPCILKDTTEKLSQISWQKKTKKNPENVNFFTTLPEGSEYYNGADKNFTFAGNFNEKNGSLRLSNVKLEDQGIYTCIFTLYPSGNHQTEIPLNVLVPPNISVKSDLPTLGDKEVSLATCTASGSHPPAQVNWVLEGLNLTITTSSSANDDGTTTTVSTLRGVPTMALHRRSVQCVITSESLSTEKTEPFTIQVFFPPTEVTIQEKSSDLFECMSNGNPEVQYTWKRSDSSWPQSAVKIDGPLLKILSWTPDINGIFICIASNSHGKIQTQLYIHVKSGNCTASWILFTLCLLLLLLGGAAFLFDKYGSSLRNEEGRYDLGRVIRGLRQVETPGAEEPERDVMEVSHNV